jgi:catecholate siderophore receptor
LDEQGNPTQSGEKSVEGIELSVVGSITDNWSVTLGYTNMNTEVDNGPTITADGTGNLTYTPDEAFTSWTTYRFPVGLTLGGGVRYTAGLHRGTDGAVGTPAYTDSYTVFDAVVSYDLSDNVILRLNAYNLSDEEYVASINKSGYRYTPGTPRTFMLSADVRF